MISAAPTNPRGAAHPPRGAAFFTLAQLCVRWQVDRRTAAKMLAVWGVPVVRLNARVIRVPRAAIRACERRQKTLLMVN